MKEGRKRPVPASSRDARKGPSCGRYGCFLHFQLERIEEGKNCLFLHIHRSAQRQSRRRLQHESAYPRIEIGRKTATPQLALVEIQVGELYANPKLTQAMIDDAMFDAENYISTEIGDEFSDQLAAALFSGNGTNKPKGILAKTITAEADGVRAFGTLQAVESAAAGVVTFDDLKKLKSSLRAKYRTGAAWIMNDTTALALSLIKDGNGDYIWRDAVAEGEPNTLFGFPVEIDENAPDIAAGAYPVLFGNFQRGYYIVRRTGRRLLRDPFTSKPYVNFYTTERVGGDVVNSECIKLLKIKAA